MTAPPSALTATLPAVPRFSAALSKYGAAREVPLPASMPPRLPVVSPPAAPCSMLLPMPPSFQVS
ncbi:TPA: hypothetical protein ACLBFA_002010 [Neisseria meningitidis]